MIDPGTKLQDRYVIVEPLARGGMGAVYKARDTRFNNFVAVKEALVAGPDADKAFEREARLLRALRHKALPSVIDYFREGSTWFLVMDFVGGETLADLLANRPDPFPVDVVLGWMDQLLEVIEFLHKHTPPIVHRDIKPLNLKVLPSGHIILLDFGLSKGPVGDRSRLTEGRSIAGFTPHYAPPEQMSGAGTDPRSDIYSSGATMYALLARVKPADAVDRLTALLRAAPDPLEPLHTVNPLVPGEVSDVVDAAMALDPSRRPQTAAAFRQRLAAAGGVTVPVLPARDAIADRPSPNLSPGSSGGVRPPDTEVVRTGNAPSAPAMRRPLVRGLAWALVFVTLTVAVLTGAWFARSRRLPSGTAAVPSADATDALLRPGSTVERTIQPETTTRLPFDLVSGEIARVTVTRTRGGEPLSKLVGPAGEPTVELVSYVTPAKTEVITADQAGQYSVDIKVQKGDPPATASIRLETWPAIDAHGQRVAKCYLGWHVYREYRSQMQNPSAWLARMWRAAGEAEKATREDAGVQTSLAKLNALIQLFRALDDQARVADLLEEVVSVSESRDAYAEALAILRARGDRQSEAALLTSGSNPDGTTGTVRKDLESALKIYTDLHDQKRVADVEVSLVSASPATREEQIGWLEDAFRVYREIGDHNGLDSAYNSRVSIASTADEAWQVTKQRLASVGDAQPSQPQMAAYFDLGVRLDSLGAHTDAVTVLERALDVCMTLHFPKSRVTILRMLVKVCKSTGDTHKLVNYRNELKSLGVRQLDSSDETFIEFLPNDLSNDDGGPIPDGY